MAPPPAAPPPPLRRSSVKATKALVNLPGSDSRDLGRKKQSKEPSDSCGGLSGTDSRPDSAHSAQREDTRRQESLRQALAKAEAAKAAAAQRQQDLRVGEMWNAVFKVSANRNDPEKLAEFWEVVKNRLLQRFGSLQDAVKGVQNPGDGSVTFPKFCDLLRLVHLPLHQSSCRAMFDKAAGGAREMPGDALKALLMDRTIRAMRFVMEGWNCKQARVKMHIRAFLKGLAETNEDMANRAIDRFQRKLTAAFFASFWQLLLSKLGGSPAEEGTLSQRSESITLSLSSLLRIMQDQEVRSRFLPNEMLYVLRIYECISSFRQSLGAPPAGISVGHFITGLVLLSPMMEREDKIAFIFQAFDNDYDGCVIYKQIHDMCRCICVLKRMAEPCFAEGSRNSSAEEEPFQAELTTQEGQRAYECIRWHLQRSGNVQGEIVSLPEFTSALKMQPSVFRALLPGTTRIRWALQAREGEDLEEQLAAAEEEAVGEANSKRAVSKNVTSPPPSVRAASKGPVAAWAASSPATGGRTPSRSTTGVRREREAFSDQQPNDFLAFERASPDRIGPRPAHLKNSKSESLFFKSHISTFSGSSSFNRSAMQNDQGSKRARLAPQGLEVGKAPEYFLLGDGVARQNFELAKKESINRTVSRVKDSGGLLEFASGLKNSSPILVTGSSGYLGAALIRLLRAHQIPCIGMDLVRASTTDHLGCVSDAAALKEAATGCHAAIHCAALHAPNLDFYTSDDFRRVNVDGTLNILRLASEMKFKGVVFSSTTSLMNTAEVKLRSKAETLVQVASTDYGTPRNIYGETKKAAESLCLGFDTVNVAILRCSRFFVEDAYDSGAAQADRKIERSNNNVKANELLCGSRASLEDTAMAHLVALVRISASENGLMVLGPLILSSVSPLIDATTREEKLAHARQSDLYVGLGWTVPDHIGRILDSRDAWENLAWSPSWSFDRLLSDYKLGMNLNMIEDGYW